MKTVSEGASGFLYYVAVAGVTGAGSADPEDIRDGVEMARRISDLPVCVGFGVKTGAQAAAMARVADGVVVGSAFVEHARIAYESGDLDRAANGMKALAMDLREAIAGADLNSAGM